jgi:hypothetical protein
MEVRAIKYETIVQEDGRVYIPGLKAGERVEVIVLFRERGVHAKRTGGWAKGKVHFADNFDDPIPGMEDYM